MPPTLGLQTLLLCKGGGGGGGGVTPTPPQNPALDGHILGTGIEAGCGRLVSGRTSVQYRFGSPFSSKVVVCGHGLVTLSLTINETLKWLSSLPILMQVILVVAV